MDKDRITREASQFQEEGSCYIHVECKDGHHEAIVTGEGGEVLVALTTVMEQIANANQSSFEQVVKMILMTHKMNEIKEVLGATSTEATSFVFPKRRKTDEDS